jgi:uncharacterized protein (UPF0264 family)
MPTRSTSGLLVSVRDAEEVDVAILGGAGLIDVKEPTRGALGMAEGTVVTAVVKAVAGRRPVSAALGELSDAATDLPGELDAGLAFVKIGLAGCGRRRGWAGLLAELRTKIETGSTTKLVAVAYADWRRADAPRPQDVISFALSEHCAAFLFDTWQKDGSTLLDWMTLTELAGICEHFRVAGVTVALAGALGRWQIRQLLSARPDWFAVRGSACIGGGREGWLSRERVERLVHVLTDPESVSNDSRLDLRRAALQELSSPSKETP